MNKQEIFGSHIKRMHIKTIPMIGNPYTSSLIGLDEGGISFLERIEKSGFTVTEGLEEEDAELLQALEEGEFFQKKAIPVVESAYLHITHRCNLHCVGCYSYEDERNELAEPDTDRMIHALDELRGNGVKKLVISGGEPLLRKDIVELMRHAKRESGFEMISLITNGTAPFSRWEELGKYIDLISFSLDGYSQEVSYLRDPGIHNRILSKLSAAKEQIPVNLIATIHRQNIDEIQEYQDLANSLGITMNISLFAAKPSEEFEPFLLRAEEYRKLRSTVQEDELRIADSAMENDLGCSVSCGAGKSLISIQSDGEVMPCHMFFGEEFSLGNLYKESLEEILRRRASHPVCTFEVDENPTCKHCEYKYVCGAGCRYRAYCTHHSTASLDPLCEVYRTHFDQVFSNIAQSIFQEERGERHAV